MICPQCDNGKRTAAGGRYMTSVGHGINVWWCETCGTLVSPTFDEPIVPTLVRRVACLLEDNVRTAKQQSRDIHDIMGKVD